MFLIELVDARKHRRYRYKFLFISNKDHLSRKRSIISEIFVILRYLLDVTFVEQDFFRLRLNWYYNKDEPFECPDPESISAEVAKNIF